MKRAAESVQYFRVNDDVDDNHGDEDDDDDDMLLPVMSTSRCLLIKRKAGCYVTNRPIDEDLEVPFFGDHSIALAETLGSNPIQGISSVTWKALILTKGCQRATALQLVCLVCQYTISQSTQ